MDVSYCCLSETIHFKSSWFLADDYEYEIVAVVNNAAGIKSREDLRDKRFCHPGYGYEAYWTRILSNVKVYNKKNCITD